MGPADKKSNDEKKKTDPATGKKEDDMEVCREAPSAEHARPFNADEPCDDGRSGK